jgi:hypothetical protein
MKLIASGVTWSAAMHQVALVLAVFLVDQDHHPAGLDSSATMSWNRRTAAPMR